MVAADKRQILDDARRRTAQLIERLLAERADLDARGDALDPARLAAGLAAMDRTIDYMRRLLHSIDTALADK